MSDTPRAHLVARTSDDADRWSQVLKREHGIEAVPISASGDLRRLRGLILETVIYAPDWQRVRMAERVTAVVRHCVARLDGVKELDLLPDGQLLDHAA